MSLLDKFSRIVVSNDARIDAEDRAFCEAHQAAYEAGLKALDALIEFKKALEEERDPNEEIDVWRYAGASYFYAKDVENRDEAHEDIITEIVKHFRNKYKVSLDSSEIREKLLPKEVKTGWSVTEEQVLSYRERMNAIRISYKDILNEIFAQLGGESLVDKGISEMKAKCHEAVWSKWGSANPIYTQKKAVVKLTGYSCSFDAFHEEFYHKMQVKLTDSVQDIIRGLVHFQYNTLDHVPAAVSSFLGWGGVEIVDFTYPLGWEKVESFRFYRNGKMDIRFTSEAFAREFVNEYLGREG